MFPTVDIHPSHAVYCENDVPPLYLSKWRTLLVYLDSGGLNLLQNDCYGRVPTTLALSATAAYRPYMLPMP